MVNMCENIKENLQSLNRKNAIDETIRLLMKMMEYSFSGEKFNKIMSRLLLAIENNDVQLHWDLIEFEIKPLLIKKEKANELL